MAKAMTEQSRLAQLKALADMVRDLHLAKLHACANARKTSLQHLANLQVPDTDPSDTISHSQARLRYENWADTRRAEINMVLARQTAQWLEARKAAETTFGRAEVIRQLHKKAGG